MDKTLLKNFAKESRKDLTQKIAVKISSYFVEDDFKEEIKGDVVVLSNNAHTLTITRDKYEKRKVLITRIKELGLNQVIEEASYTWFNRFVAIRYMEINNMLPLTKDNESLNIRVLSSLDNKLDPEIMSYSNITNPELDLKINKDQYYELKSDNEKFEYILLKVCEKLGKVIPQVFDGVTDYINILSPHNLLTEESVVGKLISIPEENFKDVEVIGWLYQYYNQEEKDRVMAERAEGYKKEDVPFVTQLFTPDWVVKYLVENSLCKYWLENKESKGIYPSENLYPSDNLYPSNSLKSNWKYYIEDAEQEPEVQAELDELKNPNLNPKDITFIDPCSGSGHILVYAFEVLYQIYESYGYNKREIPKLILENNIYGLDIDDRAGQLTILSLLLKARLFDKELFKKSIKLNIYSIQESNYINESVLYDIRSKETNEIIDYVLEVFKDAKEYGSILKIEKKNYQPVIDKINQVETLFRKELVEKFVPLLQQAILLSNKYDVMATNPPYISFNKLNYKIKDYLILKYKNWKKDMCTVFMGTEFTSKSGYTAMINQATWLTQSSFSDMRREILTKKTIINLNIHIENPMDAGLDVISFVMRNSHISKYNSTFLERQKNGAEDNIYKTNTDKFLSIEDTPIWYSVSSKTIELFLKNQSLYHYAPTKQGLATGNNDFFIREWSEVDIEKTNIFSNKIEEKWIICIKGGEYRKWYGNYYNVINWENNGETLKKYKGSVIRNEVNYFEKGITWNSLSKKFSARNISNKTIFESKGSMCFPIDKNQTFYLLGLMNSKIISKLANVISPTLDFHEGPIGKLPIIFCMKNRSGVEMLSKNNISISKTDWDSFEESWDFEKHPLIKFKNNSSIQESFKSWESFTLKQFNQLKANEEELNRIFIDIYGLQDELTPEVEDKDVTIRKADEERDIKSLISYAVGCMFGRYSLDQDGLVYAGGEFDNSKYITFKADKDNVIPINDNNYFMDDIVVKFKEFIKVAFGEEKLHENLEYIADVLGKRNTETSEDTIRRYFINDFYKDHLKTYKKKPIYWLFDSGKANGFKCLVYMHRYEENLAAKIRIDYLHKIQRVFEKELDEVKYKLTGELSPNERKDAMNLQKDLSNKLTEIKEYNENLDHIANQKINIDLDDGVTVNYAKFESVLAKIK